MAGVAGYVAVNSLGLGHASRALAIAKELVRRHPDLYLFFLAGSPALDLAVASGFDAMPLPPTPEWFHERGEIVSMGRWYREYARYLRIAGRFLRKEADWKRFRFLISDGEMASVREATRHGIPTVAIVHSIGQAFARDPVTSVVEGLGRRWMGALLSRPNVRVLGLEAGIDLPNARYIGPVVRPFSRNRETLRDELVFRKRTVLVAPGGTGIGGFLIDEAVRAWRALNLPDAQMIVVSGPKLKPDPVPGVYYKGFVPNLQDFVLAADLVIAMAGKGTMMEAIAAGTPVIAIPPKGHPEAERNLEAFGLRFHFQDAFRLGELIPEMLSMVRQRPIDLGPRKAVDEIDAFLRDHKVLG
ncbi:MAG: UDP-N-acetylglucosamine--N-acetylmuramyl-(pentapeptide) pyrophosphoryl-undecaprenol N-acetylglucosamine transferase [Methanobacteriota archaeon]|nr:MAG: UDP-N-acetylglucosamine--N-acetylmuramyl-(pentapeptide) pyrophosphoryl-undecaprenol N-acetylglucosamine transferase [Euryarchaeota archaeon]